MNIIKREWLGYRKQTVFWMIGLVVLILVAFFKVGSMTTAPGGIEAMLKSLPPFLQTLFGAGSIDYTTGVGSYSMIHLYLVVALAFHSVILGAHIFTKEESDKTFEFLYVKGVKRWQILLNKIIAGVSILLLINVFCLIAVWISSFLMSLPLVLTDILPYILALFLTQFFFFSFGLLISLVLRNSEKAAMIGCAVILGMFMLSMYVKIGGNLNFIDQLSLFHYADSSFIKAHHYGGLSTPIIIMISIMMLAIGEYLHEHRDLL